jgi:hypothetical protein
MVPSSSFADRREAETPVLTTGLSSFIVAGFVRLAVGRNA